MVTRRARPGDSIARIALFGALALAVVFGALAVETADAAGHTSGAQHAVIVPREARPNLVTAGSTKSRGSAWFASLFAVAAVAALAAYLLDSDRTVGYRRTLANFSIRLRAPPTLHVAL
jgi:hypothetical protein